MKILYVCRIFSGFDTSIQSGRWAPTGAPTIYKNIEALDAGAHDVRFVMTHKPTEAQLSRKEKAAQRQEIRLDGLRHPVRVLSSSGNALPLPDRLRPHIDDLLQARRVLDEWKRFKPDVTYVDRANLFAGALLARRGAKVVLRIMGVYPDMREMLDSRRPTARLQTLALKAPFAHVICTQDGTGGNTWMDKALQPQTPRTLRLNGVSETAKSDELDPALLALPQNKMKVLFIGRLEAIKGCQEFVEAAISLGASHGDRMHFIVVGTGSLDARLKAMADQAGVLQHITFIERLPHSQIGAAHRLADVYVSLNKLGNLSNANLEAMRAGLCMIFPQSDPVSGADMDTDELVPDDAVIRLPRDTLAPALASELARLCGEPGERKNRAEAMRRAASDFIPTWEERVDWEIRLLEQIAAGETGAAGS